MPEKKPVVRHRPSAHYTVSPHSLELVARMAAKLGVPKSYVVEMAIRELAMHRLGEEGKP